MKKITKPTGKRPAPKMPPRPKRKIKSEDVATIVELLTASFDKVIANGEKLSANEQQLMRMVKRHTAIIEQLLETTRRLASIVDQLAQAGIPPAPTKLPATALPPVESHSHPDEHSDDIEIPGNTPEDEE